MKVTIDQFLSSLLKKLTKWRKMTTPLGVMILVLLLLISFFLPKGQLQIAKENLVKNPNDLTAYLILAEELLKNNQFQEAKKALLLTEKHLQGGVAPAVQGGVAPAVHLGGEKIKSKLNELWRRKHYSDPKDIKRLISAWEKIVAEKPDYRDAWFQLALLYYKLYENEKAKKSLEKTLELDPNFKPAQKLQEMIK